MVFPTHGSSAAGSAESFGIKRDWEGVFEMLVRLREEVAKSQGAANGEDNGMNGMAYALDEKPTLADATSRNPAASLPSAQWLGTTKA